MTHCTICQQRIDWSWSGQRWVHWTTAAEVAADHPAKAPQFVKLRCPSCGREAEVVPLSSGTCTNYARHQPAVMVEVG